MTRIFQYLCNSFDIFNKIVLFINYIFRNGLYKPICFIKSKLQMLNLIFTIWNTYRFYYFISLGRSFICAIICLSLLCVKWNEYILWFIIIRISLTHLVLYFIVYCLYLLWIIGSYCVYSYCLILLYLSLLFLFFIFYLHSLFTGFSHFCKFFY